MSELIVKIVVFIIAVILMSESIKSFIKYNISRVTWLYRLYDYIIILRRYKYLDKEVKESICSAIEEVPKEKRGYYMRRLLKKIKKDLNKNKPQH